MDDELRPEIELLSEPATCMMADAWYEYATGDHFWIQWRFALLLNLLRNLDIGERILDIGCGHGIARDQLEKQLQRPVEGCDLNLYALQSAAKGLGKLYFYNVHDRRREWESFFSCAFLLDTLEHIDDAKRFLESIRFHLQKNGLLVINVPAIPALYSRYDKVVGHVKRYRASVLHRELAEAGFRVVRSSYWGLTMIPIVALRKAVIPFVSAEHVTSSGFQPASRFVESLLRLLMGTERLLFPRPFLGTSLAAIAQKVE